MPVQHFHARHTNPPPAAFEMILIPASGMAHQGRHDFLSLDFLSERVHYQHPLMAGRAGPWCWHSDPAAQPMAASFSSCCFSCSCRIFLPGLVWSLHQEGQGTIKTTMYADENSSWERRTVAAIPLKAGAQHNLKQRLPRGPVPSCAISVVSMSQTRLLCCHPLPPAALPSSSLPCVQPLHCRPHLHKCPLGPFGCPCSSSVTSQ